MRPVDKKDKFNPNGTPLEYKPYGDAKPDLINEIGDYCSFCGKHLTRSALAVEHIYPKSYKNDAGVKIYAHLQYQWNNFLLACVNCNSVKGTKDTAAMNPFLPHEDNLLCYIEILEGGLAQVKDTVTGDNLERAQAFVNLVGLDRGPNHPNYSNKDDRWEYRLKAHELAERYLDKYQRGETDLETISTLAKIKGFFAVWFTVFEQHNIVKKALISAFKGTDAVRFDAQDNYQPI